MLLTRLSNFTIAPSITPESIINYILHFSLSKFQIFRRSVGIASAIATGDSSRPNFLSIIKSARVVEDAKKYVEYEIASQLRVPTSIQRDSVVKWSIWKRYSDFETLDGSMRSVLGWQMNGIEFPSAHSLAFNKFSGSFIEQRRLKLILIFVLVLIDDE
jgi:hypothetical protein